VSECPAHYRSEVEPWDAMAAWMPPHQFIGYLRGNAIKYLARMDRKGDPHGDAVKALAYARKLVEALEKVQ
jgi:hypothetical protein